MQNKCDASKMVFGTVFFIFTFFLYFELCLSLCVDTLSIRRETPLKMYRRNAGLNWIDGDKHLVETPNDSLINFTEMQCARWTMENKRQGTTNYLNEIY